MKLFRKMMTMIMVLFMVINLIHFPQDVHAESSSSALISELLSYYQEYQDKAETDIQRVLSELKAVDATKASVWEKVMDYWMDVNQPGFAQIGTVPENLPEDDRLAIVILGFALNDDGTMKDELIGRLQTGLDIAEEYPNAYVVVTGGGTAANNPNVTEGGLMGQWLLDQGLDEERLIVENRAPDTVGNAKYTYEILVTEYPSVESVVLVTSDYHVPRGCILYYSKFVLDAIENNTKQLEIISNAGYNTGTNGYESISLQVRGVASIMGVSSSNLPAVTLSNLTGLHIEQDQPYVSNEELNLKVTARYDSGFERNVSDKIVVTGFDINGDASQVVEVSYTENGKTIAASFALNRTELQVSEYGQRLRDLLDEVKGMNLSEYSASSKEALNRAISNAETALENEGTNDADIQSAYETLTEAKNGLIQRVNVAYKMSVQANRLGEGKSGFKTVPSLLTDGTISTSSGKYWEGVDKNSTNVPANETEIILDLDGLYRVDLVKVYPYWKSTPDRYYQYELYGSKDGNSWKKIGENLSEEYTTKNGISHSMDEEIAYLKIVGVKTYVSGRTINNMHLTEVQVFGEEVDNLAYGKPVASSSSASAINDGNRDSYWDAGKYADKPSAVVDLKEVFEIDKVNVITYWQKGDSRSYHYNIYTSVNGEDYQLLHSKTSNTEKASILGDDIEVEDKVYARYVKIEGTYNSANTVFHLNELRVYGKKVDPELLPLIEQLQELISEASAVNSSSYTSGSYSYLREVLANAQQLLQEDEQSVESFKAMIKKLDDAIDHLRLRVNVAPYSKSVTANDSASKLNLIYDNDKGTYWESTGSSSISELEIVFELDGYYTLEEIVVRPFHRSSDSSTRSYFYDLYISEDGQSWTKVAEHTTKGTKDGGNSHLIDSDVVAHYVKIDCTGKVNPPNQSNEKLHLSEVYIYGEEEGNIVLNKPVTSSGDDTSVSSSAGAVTMRALDGDRSTYWDAGSYGNRPWIEVDLEGVYKIDLVNVINYYKSSRYYQFEVYTSLDGEEFYKIAEKKDSANATMYGTNFAFEEGIYASYIRVVGTYNSANSAFHLNELRAYGTKTTLEDQAAVATQQLKLLVQQTLYRSDYTAESWQQYLPVVESAKDLLEDENATADQLNAKTTELKNAIGQLVKGNPDEKKDGTFRVASFNLWAPNPAHPNVNAINEMLLRCEIDFAGLQEVDYLNSRDNRDVLKLIASDDYNYKYYKSLDYRSGGYGNGQLSVSEMKEVSGGLYKKVGNEEQRSWMRMVVEIDGKDVAIYNTHLSVSGAAELNSNIAEILEVLENEPCDYIVMTGDYNATREKMDAFKEDYNLANGNDGLWYSTFGGDKYSDGMGYVEGSPSADITSGIDNIVYSRNLQISNVRVVYNEGLSDHYMIYADFEILAYEEDLKALVDEHQYDEALFTEETWSIFEEALTHAEELLANTDTSQIQPELKAACETLETAAAQLTYKDADYTAVEGALAKIPADLSVYTEESKAALNEAVEAVVEGKDIREQDVVDGYAEAIEEALENLEFLKAGYDKVDEAIAKVPSDLHVYTDESVQNLMDAINQVVNDKNITEQDIVDGYAQAIEDAIDALVKKVIGDEGVSSKMEITTEFTAVPDALTQVYATPEDMINGLVNLMVNSVQVNEENLVVFDATLKVSFDAGATWVNADLEHLPADGKVLVFLSYEQLSALTDATLNSEYEYVVSHMFTTTDFGKIPGELEYPAVTKTADGIQFYVTGLSPIAVAWEKIPEQPVQPVQPTVPSVPSTSDSNHLMLWGALVLISLIGMIMISKKKTAKKGL